METFNYARDILPWRGCSLRIKRAVIACPSLEFGFWILGKAEAISFLVQASFMNIETVLDDLCELRRKSVVIDRDCAGEI